MGSLYGVGCAACNKEIAAAKVEMPKMDGYLSTEDYYARYKHLPEGTWPLPYVDGEYKAETMEAVVGEDGWLIRGHTGPTIHLLEPCRCGSGNLMVELWRGHVELREQESE